MTSLILQKDCRLTILRNEQSGSPTRIAAAESVSLCIHQRTLKEAMS
jgi:hypothetical protein